MAAVFKLILCIAEQKPRMQEVHYRSRADVSNLMFLLTEKSDCVMFCVDEFERVVYQSF